MFFENELGLTVVVCGHIGVEWQAKEGEWKAATAAKVARGEAVVNTRLARKMLLL